MRKSHLYNIMRILFVIYICFLVYILFLKSTATWKLSSFNDYLLGTVNLIPLYTIVGYISKVHLTLVPLHIALVNIVGNFLLFVPFAFFVHYFRRIPIKKYTVLLLPILISIELLQLITRTGSCDIDDILLEYAGSVLIYYLMNFLDL